MRDSYKTFFSGGMGEVSVKKSRFIANAFPVGSEEEASEIMEGVRKKYYDARHNCYAYIINGNTVIKKCSDDGEPQGTAGRPILEALSREGLCNVLLSVTRYFGGTLLGTGGLIRAYSDAAKEGIKAGGVMEKHRARKLRVTADYALMGKIRYIAASLDIAEYDIIYGERAELLLLVKPGTMERFTKMVAEATSASADIANEAEVWYGRPADGRIYIYDS